MAPTPTATPAHDGPRIRGIGRILLIIVPFVLIIGLGWVVVLDTMAALTSAVVAVYQATEMEIVRGVARSIEHYVGDRVAESRGAPIDVAAAEQAVFRLFVDPVRLLRNGDAWIYAPDHVVYDESGDFPDAYRGRSMAEIFAIQKAQGARHYEEMAEAVTRARPGTGWYVWLPEKGPEIAAWTPAAFGGYTWTIGLSTPLPEILQSTGVSTQMRTSLLALSLGTAAGLLFLALWAASERRRWREQRLITAQNALGTAVSPLTDMDEALGLCLASAMELVAADAAAALIRDPRTGSLAVRAASGSAGPLSQAALDDPPRAHEPRYAYQRAARSRFAGERCAFIPLSRGAQSVGCLAVGSRARGGFTPHDRRALEAVGSLTAGLVLRLQAEQSLRDGEQRFRSVVDTAAEAIVVVDGAGVIVFWSKGAERTFGCLAAAAEGTAFESAFAPMEPGAEAAGLVRRVALRGDGERFPAEISSACWTGGGRELVTYIVRDRSAQERTERERAELEQKLERAERLESIGMLAGGVAHDLNNLLTPVVGYADILLEDAGADPGARETLALLREAGERAGAVVQDLLILGRKGPVRLSPMDLGTLVDGFLDSRGFAELLARHPGVAVERRRGPGPLPISGSLPHLQKVCQNLVLNGLEAMPDGGRLLIITEARAVAERRVGYEAIEPGAYVVIECSDTGAGVDAADAEHLFEPFYAKKKMGRAGTGLGLAVVYGVVHDHGGRVDLRSAPGAGTVISLWIPRAAAAAPAREAVEEAARGGTERILLVEDQPEQREMTRRVLERAGYTVLAAEHGRAAVDILRHEAVDLMLLDMIMEESFDGLDCYRAALALHPGQKAVLVSGYAETERVAEALRLGAGGFIRKPYRKNELLGAIRGELERQPNRATAGRSPGPRTA
jgi:PAS domain S-box-containing protein